MTEEKIETTKGLCVISLTRFIMEQTHLSQDQAFEKLLDTELYTLLMDSETRLFLETNDYLRQCCQIELSEGKDALYEFINAEIAE